MRTKIKGILTLLLAFVVHISYAQDKAISGTVTDQDGLPLPGVNIVVEGTTNGTQTDFDGIYTINATSGQVILFTYVGQKSEQRTIGASNSINVQMAEDAEALDEVVVTALGIKREKKSLGYATQEVKGDAVSAVKSNNFVNSLSGKVAGLSIKSSGNLGGSTQVIIRGNNSIAGNNQALFVIDGIPVDNSNSNTRNGKTAEQTVGAGGFDYGNAASDINPDDIATINVLKGAAATALYGSRASNGVVMITTKKGKRNKGIGVTITSSLTLGTADSSTLPKYQDKYGAGYGPYYDSADGYFNLFDVDGDGNDDLTTPFTEDASYGAAFDPSLLIYQWNSIYPKLDTYQQATPYIAGANNPNYVWGTSATSVNSVSLDGGTETSTFRLGVTNLYQNGNLPNQSIKRNTISFSGSHDLSEKLTVSTYFNFVKTDGQGRNGTGYSSGNIMQQFRQWNQMNVDYAAQKEVYFATGDNITWNPNGADNLSPIYSDNPYWTFYENYETDTRNRYFGNFVLDYSITDWLTAVGRFTFDTYSALQEERINVGSADVSSYIRYNDNVSEYNYDAMLNFNKYLTEKLSLEGTIGVNLRRNQNNSIFAETNGGLSLAGFYALSNSVSPIEAPIEYDATKMVDGEYIRASLGYNNFAYLEGSYRTDRSSTLPKDDNRYGYYSVSGNIIFSEFINADWLSFGKIRANYAEVGNDTNPYRVFNTYTINSPFNGSASATSKISLANSDLLPERQESTEFGIEMSMFKRRLGIDVSHYNTQNINQITAIPLSRSTGYQSAVLNAGTIENKGWEAQITATPIKSQNFQWDVTLNWAKNESLVVELLNGIDNLQIADLQGGVSINATPGQPYGTIRGSDFIYHENGQPIVNSSGNWLRTSNSNEVIGDINPDWTGGVYNTIKYKNLSLGFLIDIQKGGDVFSLDTWYGYATGMLDWSAADNELGNPIRDPVTNGADSGGLIIAGVDEDGNANTVRGKFDVYSNPYGYTRAPNAYHVHDASYVKLREANLTYNLSSKVMDRTPFTSASVSLIGRNLWIISKNVPYADPEAGLSSGNVQGYQSGAFPSIREIGASLKLQF